MALFRKSSARSVQFSAFGGVDVLEIVDIEKPTPGPGQVVVEVFAAGINHVEAFIREGRYADELDISLPAGQGSDFAGMVTAVGDGVTAFAKNAEVLGHAVMASHATFVVVPQSSLVAKPRSLSWEIAGSLFLAGIAADDAVQSSHVASGDTVVISACAGGVGSIEAYLAMSKGATVIGTCGERNFDYLRSIGVKPVLYGDGLAERIRTLAPSAVTAYIDNFGKDNREVSDELGVPESRFRSSEHRRAVELQAIEPSADVAAEHTRVLAKLAALCADRTVNVLVSGFYPFDRVREAFDDLEKHHARGKVVLGMRPIDDSFHGLGGRKLRDDYERE